MPRIQLDRFGGCNYADPPAELVSRAYRVTEAGFVPTSPVETPDTRNMDFVKGWIGKRKGSAAWLDLTSVLVASETLIDGHSWIVPGGTQENILIVGVKSIYVKEGSGAFAQINDSASAAYTHDADVAKARFLEIDNHLLIGIDGANKIQVYKTGADLDAELDNGNTWEDTFGGGTSTVTGTWGTGYYNIENLHGRLCFGDGGATCQFTDIGQPWDLLGGGHKIAKDNIVAMRTWVRKGGSDLTPVLALFTESGLEFLPGFMLQDQPHPINAGKPPASYRAVVEMDDWMVWMTREGGFQATNLLQVIDVGRRLKKDDGTSGPMDTFDPTNTNLANKIFGVRRKRQAIFFYPDASRTTNSHAIMMDFTLGEPVVNEPLESYERRVRHLVWSIKDPGSNPWFVGGFERHGETTCIMAVGTTFNIHSGVNDLDIIPVQSYWDTPDFDGGALDNEKEWARVSARFLPQGDWDVHVDTYMDGDGAVTGQGWDWSQIRDGASVYDTAVYDTDVYVADGSVVRAQYADLWGHSIRLRLIQNGTSQDWILRDMEIAYEIGAEQA